MPCEQVHGRDARSMSAGKMLGRFHQTFHAAFSVLPNSKLRMSTSSNHTEVSVHCFHGKHTVTISRTLSDLVYQQTRMSQFLSQFHTNNATFALLKLLLS
jgi:hypothetical protein